ncbi:LLM class flavin-dependent oxidoreductase [Roseomonas sp. BN140053]|uniref:LLM class flavin-dependent oxidoreductase n=1 Tax=Roseomonas sp. BN140053 TaxID=3391898 RepID=UPI0039EA53FF
MADRQASPRERHGMKAALFSTVKYHGPSEGQSWPVPGTVYSSDAAESSMQSSLDQFRMADELGFDWVTVAEHHFAPFSLTPNPMVMAGALTQVVKRAKIALLGATVPILNPVRVAEEFAMLDTMSGGRVVAGLLRGTPNEYVTYNINPAESRARFEEALQLIRTAWTQTEPFGWQGRYYEYRSISLWPRPVQQPHPRIYMSGSSPESGEFAARNRVGLGFAVTNVPLATKAANHYREHARRHGWEPEPEDVIYRIGVHVADTDDQALEDFTAASKAAPGMRLSTANRSLESAVAGTGYYGSDMAAQRERLMPHSLQEKIDLGQLLLGSPDTVVRQIEAIHRQLGPGLLDMTIAHQMGEKTHRAIELLGERVLPRIRAL